MHMPHLARQWTVDDVQALPDDGNRYEVIDGELFVTPAPRLRHQEAVFELAVMLREYLKRHRVGHVFLAPADVIFTPTRLVQPDVFVTRLVNGRRPEEFVAASGLLLAAEARPEVLVESLARHPEGASTPLIIDLGAYFERVLDA